MTRNERLQFVIDCIKRAEQASLLFGIADNACGNSGYSIQEWIVNCYTELENELDLKKMNETE